MAKLGIDISAHQGNIDLATLKSQIDFVIIRVGYGTKGTIDSKFVRNADLCKSLGIPFGFYWYSYALDENGAEAEVNACIAAIDAYKNDYTMGVWFDMEDADGYKSKNGMPSNSTLRKICAKFCAKLEEAGYYAGIYASQSWFNNQLSGSELDPYDKWIAQWPTSGGSQKGLAVDASSKSNVSLWQFTSVGSFTGYSGNLDCDYAYKDSYRVGKASSSTTESTAMTAAPSGTTLELVVAVMQGKYGDGDARKIALGSRYDEVQEMINHIASADANTLAKEAMAGTYGNGDTRKIALGSRYDEVQAIINKTASSSSKTTYTVKSGDTLSSIAKKYGTTWSKIYAANKSVIGSDPNKIYVGQVLTIE